MLRGRRAGHGRTSSGRTLSGGHGGRTASGGPYHTGRSASGRTASGRTASGRHVQNHVYLAMGKEAMEVGGGHGASRFSVDKGGVAPHGKSV